MLLKDIAVGMKIKCVNDCQGIMECLKVGKEYVVCDNGDGWLSVDCARGTHTLVPNPLRPDNDMPEFELVEETNDTPNQV